MPGMVDRAAAHALLVSVLLLPAAFAQVDWRACQSPVKDQGNRGTCAAFAICGALETFPGVPGDLSEQLLYATLKLHQKDVVIWMQKSGHPAELREGDLFGAYVGLFERMGTCPEPFLRYDPDPKRAAADVPDDLKRYLELAHVPPAELDRIRDEYGKFGFDAAHCTVLDTDAVRDVAKLKSLLDSSVVAIPVGYRVHGPNWSRLSETGNTGADGRKLIVHPGMMERFRRDDGEWMNYSEAKLACMKSGEDLVEGLAAGDWTSEPVGKDDDYGGHAVLLVGYEDRGFIAKNSWGTGWGDDGYFKIAWDYHALYSMQGLLLRAARIRNPALSPFETTSRIKSGRFRVKVQPRGRDEDAHWIVSTWMLEPRDAAFERIDYAIDGLGADQQWHELVHQVADAGGVESRSGAPLVIDGPAFAAVRTSASVRLRLRVGVRASTDPRELTASTWMRSLEFGPFDPKLAGAVDLAPIE